MLTLTPHGYLTDADRSWQARDLELIQPPSSASSENAIKLFYLYRPGSVLSSNSRAKATKSAVPYSRDTAFTAVPRITLVVGESQVDGPSVATASGSTTQHGDRHIILLKPR
jgi:hypothetical protein